MSNLAMIGLLGAGGTPVIPEGLIILFNDTIIPDGWTRFTAADGKHIVGAGSTYAAGTTGGADLSISKATNTAGYHYASGWSAGTFDASYSNWGAESGTHSHTISGNYTAGYQNALLIKADYDILPSSNCVFLSGVGGLPLMNIFTDGYLLKSNNNISKSAADDTFSTNSTGSHTHSSGGDNGRRQSGTGSLWRATAGAHTHTVTNTLVQNVKRKILSAWTNASEEFDLESNMIAMWESATPPSGWAICDGNNGIVDLRDYFIELGADGNEDTTGTGNNTVSGGITAATSSWTHSHQSSIAQTGSTQYHMSASISHSHSATITNDVYVPPYYALYFVQKL